VEVQGQVLRDLHGVSAVTFLDDLLLPVVKLHDVYNPMGFEKVLVRAVGLVALTGFVGVGLKMLRPVRLWARALG
jgi:hypothetical protein